MGPEFNNKEPKKNPSASIPLPTNDASVQKRAYNQRKPPAGPQNYILESLLGLGLVIYIVNIFIGKRKNEHVAITWAREYCEEGEMMDRNFALIGPDQDN